MIKRTPSTFAENCFFTIRFWANLISDVFILLSVYKFSTGTHDDTFLMWYNGSDLQVHFLFLLCCLPPCPSPSLPPFSITYLCTYFVIMSYSSPGSEVKLSRSAVMMSVGILALIYFLFIKLMNAFILHFFLEAIWKIEIISGY